MVRADQLDALVGEWETEATHPLIEGVVHGRSVLEWRTGRRSLIHRSEAPPGTVPSTIAIIGGGETPGTWPMHYFDSRGVSRVYQVTFERGVGGSGAIIPDPRSASPAPSRTAGARSGGRSELQEDGLWKPDLHQIWAGG